jgi:hypothetical protein
MPALAPKIVDAPVALTVSFAAAKIAAGDVTVIELLPADVSATAVAPVTVRAVFEAATTAGPLTVDAPEPENVVNVVLALKKLFRVATAPPVNCWTTDAPLTVVPLIRSKSSCFSAALIELGHRDGALCPLLKRQGDFQVNRAGETGREVLRRSVAARRSLPSCAPMFGCRTRIGPDTSGVCQGGRDHSEAMGDGP